MCASMVEVHTVHTLAHTLIVVDPREPEVLYNEILAQRRKARGELLLFVRLHLTNNMFRPPFRVGGKCDWLSSRFVCLALSNSCFHA